MKKLHKNLRKALAIVLVCAMLVMSMGAYSGEVAYASEEFSLDGLVEVVIYETDDQVLTAYVEEVDVADYTCRLENEAGYRESQINQILSTHNYEESNDDMMRCPPPPSNSYYKSSESHFDENDIQNILDAAETEYEVLNDLSAIGTVYGIVSVIKESLFNPYVAVVAGCVGLTTYVVGKKIDRYADIGAKIALGEIDYLCHCVYVNTGSDYPKAWSYETIVY